MEADVYRFDKTRLDLAREFKADPLGEHSPDLQYLLHLMRRPSDRPFPCLVVEEDDERWRLAFLEPGAKSPPRPTEVVFTDLREAEWYVFKLRWRELAGEELPID
ncbi:MAG: hypothetical protein RMK73_02015 [Geminicoccaceae bacterium]|nr:hypothetical protein [Geminicoccaceae bacterium]MCS7267989.1 hypothetical protein [Geminicoccaceae bacterium]MDW8124097.1 hypothetical protein [Geminicoccaceae bacterium]MDW8340240.1 hypothetical protein [Geminicoccaceae bacterium]